MNQHLIIATDGSCSNIQSRETRRSKFGFVVEQNGGTIYEGAGELDQGPDATNMTAEYDAVLRALDYVMGCFDPDETKITIMTDSMHVVEQVNGDWNVNKDHLRYRRDEIRETLAKFLSYELIHESDTDHELVETADRLAKAV